MKVVAFMGTSKTGKTTCVEAMTRLLVEEGHSVGTVKEIHFEGFAMDREGTNTDRHRKAGANIVTALGMNETDVMYRGKMDMRDVLSHYDEEYVLLEGTRDFNCPKIITASSEEQIEEIMAGQPSDQVFAISGVIAERLTEYKGKPVINVLTEPYKLLALLKKHAFDRLPNYKVKCCGKCGKSCEEMCADIVAGKAKRSDCMVRRELVRLTIDGEEINMVEYVEKTIEGTVRGLLKELNGYKHDGHIKLEIGFEKQDI